MNEEIIVNSRKYTLCGFHGEVVNQQVSSTTYHNSGHIKNAGGYSNSYSDSRTYATKEFFLINQHGEEQAFSFTDKPIPSIRPGHIVQVMWLISHNEERGPYVFVRNITLNEDYIDNPKIFDITVNEGNNKWWVLFSIILFMTFVGFGLASFLGAWELSHAGRDGAKSKMILGFILLFVGAFVIKYPDLKNKKLVKNLTAEVIKRKI